MSREHVLLLDRSGYSKYRHEDGSPFLDPDEFDVTLVTLPEKAGDSRPGELARVVPANIFDTGEIVRAATEVAATHPVDAVVAVGERLIEAAARVRGVLGVPGYSAEQARVFRDKVAMKRHFAAHGIRTPDFMEITRPADALPLLERHGAVVVKPVAEMGSAGVHRITSLAELMDLDAAGLGGFSGYEAEEFIDGTMFHIDSAVEAGRAVAVSASRYLDLTDSYAGGQPLRSVEVDPGPVQETLLDFNASVLAAVPWFSGATHLEVFIGASGVATMCEIAARPGGGGIIPAFRHRFGVDLTVAAMFGQLGGPPPVPDERQPPSRQQTGWVMVYAPYAGGLRSLGEVPPADWLVHVKKNKKPGDVLAQPASAGQSITVTTVCGPDATVVGQRLDTAVAATTIDVVPLAPRAPAGAVPALR